MWLCLKLLGHLGQFSTADGQQSSISKRSIRQESLPRGLAVKERVFRIYSEQRGAQIMQDPVSASKLSLLVSVQQGELDQKCGAATLRPENGKKRFSLKTEWFTPSVSDY